MIKTQKLGMACCVINKLRIHERIMQNTWKPAGIIGNENKNFSSNLIQDFILYNGATKYVPVSMYIKRFLRYFVVLDSNRYYGKNIECPEILSCDCIRLSCVTVLTECGH